MDLFWNSLNFVFIIKQFVQEALHTTKWSVSMPFDFFSRNNKHCPTFIPDWSVVIIKLKRGPTTKVDEKGDELLMKTTVKLEKGKSLFHFPENL